MPEGTDANTEDGEDDSRDGTAQFDLVIHQSDFDRMVFPSVSVRKPGNIRLFYSNVCAIFIISP